MSTHPKTEVVSQPFRTRRGARRVERTLTRALAAGEWTGLPTWAQGVRVERAGFFQYVVVATSHKGH